jgi:hypothetical protein
MEPDADSVFAKETGHRPPVPAADGNGGNHGRPVAAADGN